MAYRTTIYRIDKKHPLYSWADNFAHSENNMQNAVLFRLRNLCTGLQKTQEDRHPIEQQVIDEFITAYNKTKNPKWEMPTKDKWLPNLSALDDVFKHTDNPDYYSDDYTVKTAQNAIKQVLQNMNSFFKAIDDFKQHPEKYNGKPNMPKYKHKGGISTFSIDNQEGKIEFDSRGRQQLKLPRTKERLRLGRIIPSEWRLMFIKVKFDGNAYSMHLIFDDGEEAPEFSEKIERIAAGDMGVDNLIACVNNVGGKSLIIKGGPVKSVNQWRNKEIARMQSEQTRGGEAKFQMTDEAWEIEHYRFDKIRDFFSKSAITVRDWCVENRIDTFVLGFNRDWKDDVVMEHKSKQTFVQIPFAQFAATLKYVLERAGIRFIEQEESYTSRASLLDLDPIPVYGDKEPDGGWNFSGYRHSRGLYKLKNKNVFVNADLNGAGNILRKAFPWAFDEGRGLLPELSDRSRVIVMKHPDLGEYEPGIKRKTASLSKARRVARKRGFVNKCGCAMLSKLDFKFEKRSPSGIELIVIA